MRRWWVGRSAIGLAATIVAACGPHAPIEPAELEEVCGEPSPFRVLELAPGEHALPGLSVVRVGERILWVIGDADFVPSVHEHGYERPQHTTVWSTGLCGESPVVVAEDVDDLFVGAEWPDHVLACDRETGDVLVLDPEGVRSPQVVSPDMACGRTWTEHGIFATTVRDDGSSALVFQPLNADPWDPQPPVFILLESLRPDSWRAEWAASHDTFAVRGDELFALEADGDLVVMDLIDGSTAIERTGVWAFQISADARWLLWQDQPPPFDDPDWSPSNVSLTDRDSGETTWLAEGSVAGSWLADETDPPYARVELGKYFGDATLVVLLPSLETHEVPDGRHVMGPIDGGTRWLVGAVQPGSLETTLLLRDLDDGTETLLFDGDGWIEDVDGGLEVLEISMWIDEQSFDQGQFWYVPYDGGAPELRAHRSSMHRFDLADGRMLTALDIHGDWIGDLVVVDRDTLEERLVATDVFAYSTGYNERGRFPDDAVAYAVDDEDDSGIWLTRLARP